MNITMFGTGYVGLVTGACFAEMGNHVHCIDVDQTKIDALNRGEIPIFEPGLEKMVQANTKAGRLVFSSDSAAGVAHCDLAFIAVGTPSDEDGSADLRYVLEVAETIGKFMEEPKIVIDKSTVPVGTADKVRERISGTLKSRGVEINFDVVSNPEFLKEGAAVSDFMKPDRIIIGSDSESGAAALEMLYSPFNRNHDKILHMDLRSAELTKYAANVMLATKISLMNEFANLAEHLDADIESVRRGIGSDPRIGHHFIYPGAGYGGSCFPKDVRALANIAKGVNYDARLIQAVEAVNEDQKQRMFEKMHKYFEPLGTLEGKTIALWGLAFKPNTDDMREAPSRTLIDSLLEAGAKVRAYDPAAGTEAARLYGNNKNVQICDERDDTLENADALAIITEWNEFRSPDLQLLKSSLKRPVIFDGRNLFEPQRLRDIGFDYLAIGRSNLD